jgi:predicted component of type VI protein secretion system
MHLRLSLCTPVPNVEASKVFDECGGTIGRESVCDWVLPDHDKVISRRHCEIVFQDGRYWLRDISANGTFVDDDDSPVATNTMIDAETISTLTIGRYRINVTLEQATAAEPRNRIPGNWDELDAGGNGTSSGGWSESPDHGSIDMPPVADTRPLAKPAPAKRDTGSSGAGWPKAGEDLFAAFLDGAGMSRHDFGDADPVEAMRQAGTAFRLMVGGLHGLLAARAALKHEMHIDRTTLSRNPLKTAPEPSVAVRSLLTRPARHGMRADEAVAEAIADIEGHEVAITAGMNAALSALLERFAPERLAQGLDRSSLLDNLLPAARRSKYWQAYEEQYREIIDEAECNFHQLFGEEFARAYLDTAQRTPPNSRRRRS